MAICLVLIRSHVIFSQFSKLEIFKEINYFLSEQNKQNFDRAMLASIVGNYSFVVWRKEFSVDIKLQKDFWLDFDLLKKYVLYVEKQHR